MDLDHTSLASRACAVRECKQRDFLPFLCGVCKHTYCSDHRTYRAHECIGDSMKDIQSFECPLCLKTIKYDKLSDPNEMFQQHYSSCTQEADKSKLAVNIKKCIACYTKLGLSNVYLCTKCNNHTCLTHRNSDDHKCVPQKRGVYPGDNNNLKNNAISDKQQKLLNNLKTSINVHKTPHAAAKKFVTPVSGDNTLKGSAFRRVEGGAKTADFNCPHCTFNTYDEVFLSVHLEDAHSGGTAITVSTPAAASASARRAGEERCPQCHQVFAEVEQLVAHFESAHGSTSTSSDNVNNCNLN